MFCSLCCRIRLKILPENNLNKHEKAVLVLMRVPMVSAVFTALIVLLFKLYMLVA
jgi:hypothetical protein